MTDADRLLKHMQRGGVVCPTDWKDRHTPDGGKTILRVAARICELRAAGYPIERIGTRHRCAVYAWVKPESEAA